MQWTFSNYVPNMYNWATYYSAATDVTGNLGCHTFSGLPQRFIRDGYIDIAYRNPINTTLWTAPFQISAEI